MIGWDDILSNECLREWKNIVIQANKAPVLSVKRYVGSKTDEYALIAFSDSSTNIVGAVIYLQNLTTKKTSFIMSKNQIISKQLEGKSMPAKELHGIAFASDVLMDMYRELTNSKTVQRIKVKSLQVYTDSLVALTWLNSTVSKFDKNKKSVFVVNRINQIMKTCDTHPITFSFIYGEQNPADCTTRCTSYTQLMKTNYLAGPSFLHEETNSQLSQENLMSVQVSNPLSTTSKVEETECLHVVSAGECLGLKSKYSSLRQLLGVYKYIYKFIGLLKAKINKQSGSDTSYYAQAYHYILKSEQSEHYPQVLKFLNSNVKRINEMPNIVKQLNLYLDKDGLIRVGSKSKGLKGNNARFPILLLKVSTVTDLIVSDIHQRFNHAGLYTVLKELRTKFWIPHCFVTVKKNLKKCPL